MDSQNKDQILAEIKDAKSKKDFDTMLALAQKATGLFPSEDKVFGFLHDAQAHYVDEKLDSQIVHDLEQKKDWRTLQAIYQKLLVVFPESKKLHKLLKKVRKQIDKGATEEERQQFEDVRSRINEFVKAGKLDEALQACYEILAKNPGHDEFEAIADRIESKINGQIEKDLSTYFKESESELKEEYQANKGQFISV